MCKSKYQIRKECMINLLKYRAGNGDAEAQLQLGRICHEGHLVRKNLQNAAQYYIASAENGSAEGQRLAGICYWKGIGVKKDRQLAKHYFGLSAAQGLPAGQFLLGMYYLQDTPDRNISESNKWLKAAALQGHEDARRQLWNHFTSNMEAAI